MKNNDIEDIRIVGFKPLSRKKSAIFMALAVVFGVAMLFISFFLLLIAIYVVIILAALGALDKYNLGLSRDSKSYQKLQRKRKVILLAMVILPLLIMFTLIIF